MTQIVSTVPGALKTLRGYLQTVADANTGLNAAVYFGPPTGGGNPTPNYLMVGNYENGELISGYEQDFRTLSIASATKNEDYIIPCAIRTWSGDNGATSQFDRINDAFALLDGVMQLFQTHPTGTGALSSSGTWQVSEITMPESGPSNNGGWGVMLAFEVHVFNVTIQ